MQNKNQLRNLDLAQYEPGSHIPADVFQQDHWVGLDSEYAQYSGRLQGLLSYIENYYLHEHPTATKVLAVQKEYGVYIAVGAEASAILSQRAANTVRNLRKTSDMMSTRVDRRYMTPEEQRRHDTVRQRVQLQIESLDRAETTYAYQRQKAEEKQTQSALAD
jgi:hypothetical protein